MITITIDWKEFVMKFIEKKTIYEYLREMIWNGVIQSKNFTVVHVWVWEVFFASDHHSLKIEKWSVINLVTAPWPCWFY